MDKRVSCQYKYINKGKKQGTLCAKRVMRLGTDKCDLHDPRVVDEKRRKKLEEDEKGRKERIRLEMRYVAPKFRDEWLHLRGLSPNDIRIIK